MNMQEEEEEEVEEEDVEEEEEEEEVEVEEEECEQSGVAESTMPKYLAEAAKLSEEAMTAGACVDAVLRFGGVCE